MNISVTDLTLNMILYLLFYFQIVLFKNYSILDTGNKIEQI